VSWIRTSMKPVKICIENPDFPLAKVFSGYDWKLSGGTKQLGLLSAAFILANNVDTVIEIGTWQGFSSAILAKALAANSRDGLLISVDVSSTSLKHSENATKDIPITHNRVMIDSMLVDYRSLLNGRTVGLAFVDGNHHYEYTKHDIRACYEVLRPYGIIAVHDYSKTGYPGVYSAVNEFVAETKDHMFFLEENRESTDYRSAIIQKKGNY
jgi:predicted O-methyltransferase YrrM